MTTGLAAQLAAHNRVRFSPALPDDTWREQLDVAYRMALQEIEWVENCRDRVKSRAAAAPRRAEEFVRWFEDLKAVGPGQGDPLFRWLEAKATREQLRWFVFQEVAGEAGFEDLLSITQVRLEGRPKLEMARNYWDEMGRGTAGGMHGPMLSVTAREMKIDELDAQYETAAVELSNLMSAMAHHRRHAFHSIGALGVIELTAPTRVGQVYAGLRRVGVTPDGGRYFLIHSTLDVKHSAAWNAEVFAPLVAENPERAVALAEGALMRLEAGARCFEAYRAHFEREGASFDRAAS
jgi:hypothetical protein